MGVKDPVKAVIGVENYLYATSQLAQTTLRSALGETELDELLMNREEINNILRNIIDKRSEDWRIEMSAVGAQNAGPPTHMKRGTARPAAPDAGRRPHRIRARR